MSLNDSFNAEKPRPLISAVRENNLGAAEFLLQRGADVNERGSLGATPLMYAAAQNNKEMVLLLIRAGADATERDYADHSATDFAAYRHYDEIVQILADAPAIRQHALDEAAAALAAENKARFMRESARQIARAETQDQLRGRAPKLRIKPAPRKGGLDAG